MSKILTQVQIAEEYGRTAREDRNPFVGRYAEAWERGWRSAHRHLCSIVECTEYAVWTTGDIHYCDCHRHSNFSRAREYQAAVREGSASGDDKNDTQSR